MCYIGDRGAMGFNCNLCNWIFILLTIMKLGGLFWLETTECLSALSISLMFIVNCMYWERRFPRLLNTIQFQDLMRSGCPLVGISDITCDVGGSIEFINQTTSIDSPFFRYIRLIFVVVESVDCHSLSIPSLVSINFF